MPEEFCRGRDREERGKEWRGRGNWEGGQKCREEEEKEKKLN